MKLVMEILGGPQAETVKEDNMNKKQYPIPATIVIRLNGDETTATVLGDEFKISGITRTHAKRNPKDEYDAYIGARVALDRLFGKDFFEEHLVEAGPEKSDATEETNGPKFHVGDIVRVTDAVFPFGGYATGDVAVVTRVDKKVLLNGYCYSIKVRSRERKGRGGYAWEEELTLLHRAKGAEQA